MRPRLKLAGLVLLVIALLIQQGFTLFNANPQTSPNTLYHNHGDGTFSRLGLKNLAALPGPGTKRSFALAPGGLLVGIKQSNFIEENINGYPDT